MEGGWEDGMSGVHTHVLKDKTDGRMIVELYRTLPGSCLVNLSTFRKQNRGGVIRLYFEIFRINSRYADKILQSR